MNILILGAGQVGETAADSLSGEEAHQVTIVDKNETVLKKLQERLDARTVVGHASYPEVLDRAGAKNADMIIAVTRSDETNMVICQIAHSIFNIPKKISRIRSQEFLGAKWNKLYTKSNLPIDVIISPELEVAKSLQRKLEAPGALDSVPFADGKIKVLEINVDKKCPLINTELGKLTERFPDLRANILGVIRGENFLILKKKDKLMLGDKAFVVINAAQINKTLAAFGHDEKMAKKILIIGGGNIGFNLAKNIEESFDSARIKIIEKDKQRAEHIANELNNTIIINGNGLEENVLTEANIDEAETVIALTNDDEDNLMASVMVEKISKNKRTMALINKPNYSLLQSSLKIDDLIDPRMNTVSSILKHVHKGTIQTAYTLLDGEYEVIEAEIIDTSELINKELKKANLPDSIRIGAVLRGKEIIIPRSSFVFKEKDIVVFLAQRDQLSTVESMFRISSF